MNPDDGKNPNGSTPSLKTMFLAQAKARKAKEKPVKKQSAKKPPSSAVESNKPSASVTEKECERDSAREIESLVKERERDSAREMKSPDSERDREKASTSAECEPESIRSPSAGKNVSGSSQVNFYSAKNSSLAEQTPGMDNRFDSKYQGIFLCNQICS